MPTNANSGVPSNQRVALQQRRERERSGGGYLCCRQSTLVVIHQKLVQQINGILVGQVSIVSIHKHAPRFLGMTETRGERSSTRTTRIIFQFQITPIEASH